MTEALDLSMRLDAAAGGRPQTSIELLHRHAVQALALALAFFAPWGEASGTLYGFGLSKIFVVTAFLFVLVWAIGGKPRFAGFPRWFNLLMLFLVGHMIVYFLAIEKGGLGFGYVGEKEYQGVAFGMVEERGMALLRFFLFAGVAYGLTKYLDSARRFQTFCLMYGLGLCAMLLFTSGYRIVGQAGQERFSGSFFNPNSFAMTCWTALFLGLFLVRSVRGQAWKRLSMVAIILAAGYGLLSSGSRSGLLGVMIGLIAVTACSSLRRGAALWVPIGALIFSVVLIALVPERVLMDLGERVALQRIRETGGARRLEIWHAYADHLDEYVLFGVGLNNGPDVVERDFYSKRQPHNLFLKMLVDFGIVGLVLFVVALWHLFRLTWQARERLPERAAILGLFVCWLTSIMFHDFLFARDTWIILACVSAFARTSTVSEP